METENRPLSEQAELWPGMNEARQFAPFISTEKKLESPLFFKYFDCSGPTSAKLEITGLGLYRAFLNGQRVGDTYLTPGFNEYDAYLRYQTYDVTTLLQEKNCLEVYLGDGWYKGRFGMHGGKTETYGERYLLSAKLTYQAENGQWHEVLSDDSWRARPSHILSSSIYDGESRDGCREDGQSSACVIAPAPYHCVPEFNAPIRAKKILQAELISNAQGEQLLDFGQNMVGVVRFKDRASVGQKLRLQFGELLQEGCFYRDNLRSAKAEFTYVSDGKGQVVEPYFTYFGFRYVKLEGFTQPQAADFEGVVLYADLEETLFCQTDSPLINKLMQNALWSQRGNFLDVPTDCPQRDERLGWTADTQVFVNTACFHMNCHAFYRKYLRDLRVEQVRYYAGDIPMFSPSLRGSADPGGAVWADAATIIPWHVYQNYGDKVLLAENYPLMRDYTEHLIGKDSALGQEHIITQGFTFGDWLAQDGVTAQAFKGSTDDSFIRTVYYYNSLLLSSKAAAVLEIHEDAQRFGILAAEVKQAILAEYFSVNGRFVLDTQTAYVLALHFELYPDRARVVSAFQERLKKDFYKLKTGFVGTPLLLPVLFDHGLADDAYRMLYSEDFPGWLYTVKLGATTIWERWNSLLPDGRISGTEMNSLNHYAYGSVCEAIYTRIAGLRCASPGWSHVKIAPQLNPRMQSMDLSFKSPAGPYRVSWRWQNDREIQLDIEIPAAAQAEIILPFHPERLCLEVGAGQHHFTYQSSLDFTHPFSIDSKIMDILAHREARVVFSDCLSAMYAFVTGENQEFLVLSPRELAERMPFFNEADVKAQNEALQAVPW